MRYAPILTTESEVRLAPNPAWLIETWRYMASLNAVGITVCPGCGQWFVYDRERRGRPRTYCTACRPPQQQHQPPQQTRVCPYCGGPTVGPAYKKYCSDRCRDNAKKKRRYHSDPEYRARLRADMSRRYLESAQPPRERICAQCGSAYTPQKNHPENRFCSRACRDKYWDRANRARTRHIERVPYKDTTILERDGWRCRLCGQKIDKRLRHPHPMSASIDHIVPLALGGRDAPDNVQAAHLSCNAAKGTRAVNEQLILVG